MPWNATLNTVPRGWSKKIIRKCTRYIFTQTCMKNFLDHVCVLPHQSSTEYIRSTAELRASHEGNLWRGNGTVDRGGSQETKTANHNPASQHAGLDSELLLERRNKPLSARIVSARNNARCALPRLFRRASAGPFPGLQSCAPVDGNSGLDLMVKLDILFTRSLSIRQSFNP